MSGAIAARGSDRRAWPLLWAAMFVSSWGGNQFSPLLLMYERDSHLSELMVTALLGIYVLGLAPALLIAGSLSDRHGRRPVMLVGLLAAVLGSALLALGPFGVGFLAAGRLLSGVTVGVGMSVGASWMKELSQPPFDVRADVGSGARRASLAFTTGSATGALVAGLLAQWGPIPRVLPFLLHIALAVPLAFLVLRMPETQTLGGVAGPWWRQLRIPNAGHRRFVRVVAVAAPWIFAAAGLGYAYLPNRLASHTGTLGILYATAATVIALGASSGVQPLAKRIHSLSSARGLVVGTITILVGLLVVVLTLALGSPWVGLGANVVLGAGFGISLVSGLLEVQRIAEPSDLAGLTGVFYALAYAGFLLPMVIAGVTLVVSPSVILPALIVLAVATVAVILWSSRRHLPTPEV